MNPALRELIDGSTFYKGSVRAVGALLPVDDAELDAIVAETVAKSDLMGFLFVLTAALDAGRSVDARHIGMGASMAGEQHRFCNLAWKMKGDVPAAMMTAIRRGGIPLEIVSCALLITALWCRKHRDGVLPEEFFSHARELARHKELRKAVRGFLLCTAQIVNDPALNAILKVEFSSVEADVTGFANATRNLTQAMMEICERPVLELIVDAPQKIVASGVTMRRAVEKIGRNDDCPCGSGKKYKRCCFDKDQERLHLSTSVAGKTHAELRDAPEAGLTIHRLEKMCRYELEQLDPTKVPETLRVAYLMRAVPLGVADRAVELFERSEVWDQEIIDGWFFTAFFLMRAREKELAKRMITVFERHQEADKVRDGLRLLAADGDPAEELRILDVIATKMMKETEPERLSELAYDVLASRHKALGILLSRSLIPLVPSKNGSFLFDEILHAHDHLNLPPDDPYGDILEKRIADETGDDGKDAGELRLARRKLEAKAAEVRQLKEDIERQRREVRRQEKKHASSSASHDADAEAELRELRQKLAALKSTLHERAEERTALRRELESARDALEKTRAAATAKPDFSNGQEEDEAAHYLPEQPAGNQPLRIIEFPPKFRDTLDEFPQHIARAALATAGRLAGGEPAAFAGVVALKALPGVYRQRIGGDHRLLFRLHPDRLQLVALINRRDLDRKIKSLRQ